VGTQCNARCTFCFSANFNTRLPDSIIDEWRGSVLPVVNTLAFGGGEPLVVACDLIEEAVEKRPDIRIALTTNGILLDRMIPVRNNISGINVSLNAGSRDVYRNVSGVDAFDRVVDNVKSLRKAGYTGPISSTFVLCRENVHDVLNYLTVCKEMEVNSAGFNIDRTDPFLRIPNDLQQRIRERAEEIGVLVNFGYMRHDPSPVSKAKRLVLYYVRYRSRHRVLGRST
jgi:MoaA/NifB/PqqE/SkfB family radical SAM enzyme